MEGIEPQDMDDKYRPLIKEKICSVLTGVSLLELRKAPSILDMLPTFLTKQFEKMSPFSVAVGRVLLTNQAFIFEGDKLGHRIEWDKIGKIEIELTKDAPIEHNARQMRIHLRNEIPRLYIIDDNADAITGDFTHWLQGKVLVVHVMEK